MNLILLVIMVSVCIACTSSSPQKYSTPVTKVQIQTSSSTVGKTAAPPSPTNMHKKYVDFDLKSQSSRYSNEDPYVSISHSGHNYGHHDGHYGHHNHHKSFDYHKGFDHHKSYDHHFYPYESYDYYEKSYGIGHYMPYVLGGLGMLLLPLLTLWLTLAVNVAPGNNIPTAVTTATGKLLKSLNSTDTLNDVWATLDSAISKYGRQFLDDE